MLVKYKLSSKYKLSILLLIQTLSFYTFSFLVSFPVSLLSAELS